VENHKYTNHQEWLVDELADPELAALYLTAALEDSPEMFLEAVKDVAQAKHKISEIAKQAGITRESVYRSFSADGNPAFKTFLKFLDILDIEMKFQAKAIKTESETPIAPAQVDDLNELEMPVAAKSNGILTLYIDESGFNAVGHQSLQILDTRINIASPIPLELDVDKESMAIHSQVSKDAMLWDQQQRLRNEEQYV